MRSRPQTIESTNVPLTFDRPFDLRNEIGYRAWRDWKLANYPRRVEEMIVEVDTPAELKPTEKEKITRLCALTNMALVRVRGAPGLTDKEMLAAFGRQFGLDRLDQNPLADDDAISALRVSDEKGSQGYIPYTSRRLLWHTDGYYNPNERRIRAFSLFCASAAARGGENELLDHEIAYIHLRDQNPEWIGALEAGDAMTIPANRDAGIGLRAAQSGPVFTVDSLTGSLHMRYTSRTRSIVWRDDAVLRSAVRALEEVLAGNTPYMFRHRLSAGEGLICNNVLHNRTAFEDGDAPGQQRLMYRARYHDRIEGTGLSNPTR